MESEFVKIRVLTHRKRKNSGCAVQLGSGCGGDCTVLCIDDDYTDYFGFCSAIYAYKIAISISIYI